MSTLEDRMKEMAARNTEQRAQARTDLQRQRCENELAKLHDTIQKTLEYLDDKDGLAGPSPYATGDYSIDKEKHPEIRWGIYNDGTEQFGFWEFEPANVVIGYDKSAHERPICSWQGSYVLLRDGRIAFVASKHFSQETDDVLFYDIPESVTKLDAGAGAVRWETTPRWSRPSHKDSRYYKDIECLHVEMAVRGLKNLQVKAELWSKVW